AIRATGYVLDINYGWGREWWVGALAHVDGFRAQLNVAEAQSWLTTDLIYNACSQVEWRAVHGVLDWLGKHGLLCEGNYRMDCREPFRYSMCIQQWYQSAFEQESFCGFLRAFANKVVELKRRIPGSEAV